MAPIELEPVDRFRVTILMDNVTDPLIPDHGPVTRVSWPKALAEGAPCSPAQIAAGGLAPDGWAWLSGTSRRSCSATATGTTSRGWRAWRRLAAVIGGFHLSGPMFEGIIPTTVLAFDELSPSLLLPAHCTGWKAVHRLAARFPDAFVQSAVGTTVEV